MIVNVYFRVVPNGFKDETVSMSKCSNTFKARVNMFNLFKHSHQNLDMAMLMLEELDFVTLL